MHRFLLTVFLCTCVRAPYIIGTLQAQDTILWQAFEPTAGDELPYTTDVTPHGTGGVPTWNRVDRIKNIDTLPSGGTHFWAARDVENPQTGGPVARLSFDAGSICELTSARFVFSYQVVGYDGGDDFGYELYLDGFLQTKKLLVDGRNGGGVSTDGWVSDTVPIPGTAQTARLVIYFDQNGDDVAALDNIQLLATGRGGSCNPTCGLRLGTPVLDCQGFTDGPDALSVRLPYRGAETGVTINIDEGSVGGDDPAVTRDGTIRLSDLREGLTYRMTASGGDCDLELTLEPPADQCRPSPLVINEILAAPGQDINHDGAVTPADEFVEILNVGNEGYPVAGHTLHDASNSGARFTFPEGAVLQSGERFVVYAGTGDGGYVGNGACQHGVARGFLGLNDNTPERVILRDPEGRVVAQASFDDAPDGESLTLHPDGNLAGGYRPYGEVYTDGRGAAPCELSAAAPVELAKLTATPLRPHAVRIDWVTEREVDNAGFVVERSKEGIHYHEIGEVAPRAGGGSYFFVDADPFTGVNFYRLRQVDYDGREELHGPVGVRLDSGRLLAYPNPATDRLYLGEQVRRGEEVTVYRTDGRRVQRGTGPTVDVSELPPGIYYARVRQNRVFQQVRFVKQ